MIWFCDYNPKVYNVQGLRGLRGFVRCTWVLIRHYSYYVMGFVWWSTWQMPWAMSCPQVWYCGLVGYHFVKLNKPSLTFFSAESFMTFSLIRSSHQLYSETESEWKAPFLILQFFGWKLFFLLKKDTLQSLTSYLMYWYGQSVQSYGTWQSCQTGTCFRVYNLRSRINWGE